MVTRQDSSHPTGVSADDEAGRKRLSTDANVQRLRKADAALSLRLSGASWGDIAQTVGYPTPRTAMLAVEKALIRQLNTDDDRDKMRVVAGARLERLLRAIWAKALNPNDPEQMVAVARARDIIDRHAKLYGLDAPTEVVVHSPTQSDLEDWVLRMTATLVPDVDEPDIFDAEIVQIEAS
jgi:hypothetical protein